MIIKVGNMRINIEKVSFIEYDPEGTYELKTGRKGKGVSAVIVDGVHLTVPDPAAKQIEKAFNWLHRDTMYIADKGEIRDWKKGEK